jgi:Transposase IS66 family
MSLSDVLRPNSSVARMESVEYWRDLVREQQQVIESQQQQIEALTIKVQQQEKRIEQLEAEIRTYKKLKGKPQLSASKLNEPTEAPGPIELRGGRTKRSKKLDFKVDEERRIQPKEIPADSKFNGYRSYDVQEIEMRRRNIRFQLAEYVTPDGTTVVGELPPGFQSGHFGPKLVSYVLYQHYQCRVPQPLIYEQLRDLGIEISVGQINRILTEKITPFVNEQHQVLRVGLATAQHIHTDDTGAKHQGKNGFCTVIGNEYFAYFKSSHSKSRQNFLEVLQGPSLSYVLNEEARTYLKQQSLADKYWLRLVFSETVMNQAEWDAYLLNQGITGVQAVRRLTEAALLGGLMAQGMSGSLRILSDGARQFNLLNHGLCWVHIERGLRKLSGHTQGQRQDIAEMQDLLWEYYQQLQQYKENPTEGFKAELWQRFDQIFGRCYRDKTELNTVLHHIRDHKAELLQVLDYPKLPLHNNAAETDIREYVTRRKISGGTRSDAGRLARDIFVGLKKTCRKLGVSFWDFLMSRTYSNDEVPLLPDLIRIKASETPDLAISI